MENGVNKPVADTVVDEKVEENFMMSSDESNDVEDVFEEAVGTPDPLNDRGTKVEIRDDGHVVGDSGLVIVNGGSNVVGEIESFEEAEGVPSEVGNDVVGEGKVEDLAGTESVIKVVIPDKVGDGGSKKGVTSGELNEGTEVSEVGAGVENEVLKDGFEKPENGDSSHVNVEESAVDTKLENGTDGMVGTDGEINSSGEVLPEDSDHGGLKENKSGAENQDGIASELIDASAGTLMEFLDDKGELLNDKCVRVNMEQQKNESEEVKDVISGVGSGLGNFVGEEASDSSARFETQHENERNIEVKDTAAGVDSKHHEETCELEGTSADIHEDVVEGTVTPEIGISNSLDGYQSDE